MTILYLDWSLQGEGRWNSYIAPVYGQRCVPGWHQSGVYPRQEGQGCRPSRISLSGKNS